MQVRYSPLCLFTRCPGQAGRRQVAVCLFLSFPEVFLLCFLPSQPAHRGTARSHSFPATPCVLVNYRSAQVINLAHFMHSHCCTLPLKSQYLCSPFHLAIYLGRSNRNQQASQLKHGKSRMPNLNLAVPEPSVTAATLGLQFFKNCILAKLVKAQYTSRSFKSNLIQIIIRVR